MVNNKDLPCDVIRAVVNDDNAGYNKHLPGDKIGVLVAEDDYGDEMITYLITTKNTKGELTIPNVDKFYDVVMWSSPVEYYYGVVEQIEKLNSYLDSNDIMNSRKNELCMSNIRLIFDDGDVYKRQIQME